MTGIALRGLFAFLVALGCLLQSALALAAPGKYVHAHVEGVINPIEQRYVERAIARAIEERADFVLLSIDTPGGLVSSLQKITTAITNAPLPVVGFVEPRSAQATSAGAFILLATDVAAMAPGTRVGAAHPVADGKPLEGALDDKATNSLASLAKSLAARRGRPTDPAEAMVRSSKNFTDTEARAAGLVEILAVNRAHLLTQLHGRTLEIHGKPRIFDTRGISVIELPMTRTERLLDWLADPTLASLLLSLGTLAILYELSSPGVGMGGIVGSIALLLGLLAMSVLPLEIGGMVLIGVGLAAIAVEVKVPTHGLLAGGGIVALVLGGLLLVDPSEYFGGVQRVALGVVGPVLAGAVLFLVLLARTTSAALSAAPITGVNTLVGRRGLAKTAFTPEQAGFAGSLWVDGARWQGVASAPISAGDAVVVRAVLRSPMRLEVEPVAADANQSR
jgi:membrane-bound serine protease (ClpP class)